MTKREWRPDYQNLGKKLKIIAAKVIIRDKLSVL